MTRFYDKGTYVKIIVGNEVYRVPKNQGTVRSNSERVIIRDLELSANQFSVTPNDVDIPYCETAEVLGERIAEMFHVTEYDPNTADGLTMFDGTDTTVGFDDVTEQHEPVVTVVEGDVTGELTTTTDPTNNEVTVTSDNPEDDGILHVELLGASLGL